MGLLQVSCGLSKKRRILGWLDTGGGATLGAIQPRHGFIRSLTGANDLARDRAQAKRKGKGGGERGTLREGACGAGGGRGSAGAGAARDA